MNVHEPELGQEYDTHRVILRSNPHRDSQAFQRILHGLLPEWVAQFRAKNADYSGAGAEPHKVLGVQGQFADIWRKIWKLKKALWDGQTLAGEQPEEILRDLIGHCFLTLDLLREAKVERLEADLDAHRDLAQRAEDAAAVLRTAGMSMTDAGPFQVRPDGLVAVDPTCNEKGHDHLTSSCRGPANEEEAYTAQRTARFKRQQQDAQDARRWREAHCGRECGEGHTYRGECAMAGTA